MGGPGLSPDPDGRAARRRSSIRQIAEAYHLAHEIVTAALVLAVLAGGGAWLDRKLSWSPVLTVTGAVLGLVTAGLAFRNLLNRLDRDSKNHRSDSPRRSNEIQHGP